MSVALTLYTATIPPVARPAPREFDMKVQGNASAIEGKAPTSWASS